MCVRQVKQPKSQRTFLTHVICKQFCTWEVWIIPTWRNVICVASHESCYQGYYILICCIWPVNMQTSLDSRAMHHARFVSDATDPLKMKVNVKYNSKFSSYRAVNTLLVYKWWLTAEWQLLPQDTVDCQSSLRHSVSTKKLKDNKISLFFIGSNERKIIFLLFIGSNERIIRFWCRIHLWFRLMGGLQANSMTSQRNRAVRR